MALDTLVMKTFATLAVEDESVIFFIRRALILICKAQATSYGAAELRTKN